MQATGRRARTPSLVLFAEACQFGTLTKRHLIWLHRCPDFSRYPSHQNSNTREDAATVSEMHEVNRSQLRIHENHLPFFSFARSFPLCDGHRPRFCTSSQQKNSLWCSWISRSAVIERSYTERSPARFRSRRFIFAACKIEFHSSGADIFAT